MNGCRVALLLASALIAVAALPFAAAQVSNIATSWLWVTQQTVAALQVDNQVAGRLYGLVGSAQYEAIKIAEGRGWSQEAAAALASHATLSYTAYWRQSNVFDPLLKTQLAGLGVSDSLVLELQRVLQPVVQRLLDKRLSDKTTYYSTWRPAPNGTIGAYQYVPGQATVRYPQVANATGYYLTQAELDKLTAPYRKHVLSSAVYQQELDQVYRLGHVNSTERTQTQSDTARFYALGAGTSTISGFYLNASYIVLPSNFTLKQTARFYKILGSSIWDAGIACFKVKFRELFWRPITAIRTPHTVGPSNAASPYDPTWAPLLSTPVHPEYPSGHTCSAGAAVYVFQQLLGDSVDFTLGSEGAPDLPPRQYTSLSAQATDAANSRLWAGVHFNKANVDGLAIGSAVAKHIFEKYFESEFWV